MFAIEHGDGVVVVSGRLDAAQSGTAQAFLDQVQGTVVVDCTRLEYISSAGLGVILKTQKRLRATQGMLRLCNVNNHLRDVFRFAGFDRIIEIESSTG